MGEDDYYDPSMEQRGDDYSSQRIKKDRRRKTHYRP